jgi:hypothetical protein
MGEELAYKPLEALYGIPTDSENKALETQNIIRNVLEYKYGEDISRWFVIPPFIFAGDTLATGSILSLFDGLSSTYYQLDITDGSTETTSIILDLGKPLDLRGAIFSFTINAGTTGTRTVTSSYTQDGTTWIQIDSTNQTANFTYYYDHLIRFFLNEPTSRGIRAFKIDYTTSGDPTGHKSVNYYQFMAIV